MLTQVLAIAEKFVLPSNLIARFCANLAFGARVQRVLQAVLPKDKLDFRSTFGRTKEWWAPSEFGFFWEHHVPLSDCHELTEKQLTQVDTDRFLRELAGFEAEAGQPIFMKAVILNYHLPFLHRLLPKAVFVRMKWDVCQVIQSLLLIRRELFGTFRNWCSIRPRDWKELARLEDPVEQVTAQISTVERALDDAFCHIPTINKVTIDYESFCANPHAELLKIETALAALDYPLSLKGSYPQSFCPVTISEAG